MDRKKDDTPRYAAALKYEPIPGKAPRVTAAGRGEVARAIHKLADEHQIPVYHDAHLAQTLYQLGLDSEIPPELYEVVAQVLVFVARLDQK